MTPLSTRSPLNGDVASVTDLIGDARIVAIGENNHHIREFGELRARSRTTGSRCSASNRDSPRAAWCSSG